MISCARVVTTVEMGCKGMVSIEREFSQRPECSLVFLRLCEFFAAQALVPVQFHPLFSNVAPTELKYTK